MILEFYNNKGKQVRSGVHVDTIVVTILNAVNVHEALWLRSASQNNHLVPQPKYLKKSFSYIYGSKQHKSVKLSTAEIKDNAALETTKKKPHNVANNSTCLIRNV